MIASQLSLLAEQRFQLWHVQIERRVTSVVTSRKENVEK